jgi:hypothetical protein
VAQDFESNQRNIQAIGTSLQQFVDQVLAVERALEKVLELESTERLKFWKEFQKVKGFV